MRKRQNKEERSRRIWIERSISQHDHRRSRETIDRKKRDERREKKKRNVSDVTVRADCGCTQKNKKAFLLEGWTRFLKSSSLSACRDTCTRFCGVVRDVRDVGGQVNAHQGFLCPCETLSEIAPDNTTIQRAWHARRGFRGVKRGGRAAQEEEEEQEEQKPARGTRGNRRGGFRADTEISPILEGCLATPLSLCLCVCVCVCAWKCVRGHRFHPAIFPSLHGYTIFTLDSSFLFQADVTSSFFRKLSFNNWVSPLSFDRPIYEIKKESCFSFQGECKIGRVRSGLFVVSFLGGNNDGTEEVQL